MLGLSLPITPENLFVPDSSNTETSEYVKPRVLLIIQ